MMSHLFLYLDHHLIIHLLFLFIFIFIHLPLPAQSNNITSQICSSYTCGNVTIKYPFWKNDSQSTTQFCGYDGFGISCSDDQQNISTITLGGDLYYVKEIDYTFETIFVADYDVSPAIRDPDTCPRVRHNITMGTSLLNFTTYNVNISFHFDCNGCPPFATEISCLERNARKTCLDTDTNREEFFWDWDRYSCEDVVVTTVTREFINLIPTLQTNFSAVLENGFMLQWMKTDACDKCEETDGHCGYNNSTGFVCYCPGEIISIDYCKGSRINLKRKLIIGFCSAGFTVFVLFVVFYFWKRRNNKRRYYSSSYMSRKTSSYSSSMADPEKNGTYHGVPIFKYRELEKATNYFDEKNELGDGGFGTVYQGKLKDGRVVAVKRLYENNYKRVEQFMNEVALLARLRHRNLVTLYGCTTHHSRELLLVYEYIPNGTVADHLHGAKAKPGSLTWTTRMSIALETASALVYLHASDVVHRDVKTNNILLDSCFTVKVADFGLSRLFPSNVTHVSTAPQGTPGYVDPEYHECYQLTNKSDVYSFGVVLVELISSKPAVDITRHRHEINLSSMALSKIQNNAIHELVDPNLGYESEDEVRKMINAVAELAFQCLQNERDCRPSMDEVLEYLLGIQNGMYSKVDKKDVSLDGACDDAVLMKNYSANMSPDSVAVAWSTSTLSVSSG